MPAWRPESRFLSGSSKEKLGRVSPKKVTLELRWKYAEELPRKKGYSQDAKIQEGMGQPTQGQQGGV